LSDFPSRLLSKKVVGLFLVLAAAALWLSLNGIVYLGTDLNGLRYQYALFNHSPLAIPEMVRIEVALVAVLALGLPGLVILVSVSRILVDVTTVGNKTIKTCNREA
jgi:hypothetical protein